MRPRPGPGRGERPWAPPALVLLSIGPLIAGTLRLIELTGGPQLLPENPRVSASPEPLVLHVGGASLYALLGAFQFSAALRRRHPAWHRGAGRVLVGAGLVVAGSGLWMTLFYAGAPGGIVLWSVRLVVSTMMIICIALGVAAIRRRDVPEHRAWMIRAYALAVGAGTQMLTQGIGEAAFGTAELSTALSIASGWVLNLAVAEWVIRRGVVRPRGGAGARRVGARAR